MSVSAQVSNNLSAMVGTGAGALFLSGVLMNAFNKLPNPASIVHRFTPKPNAVFVAQNGPLFGKLENYIVAKYLESIRSCQLAPRNGQISFALNEIKLHKPLIDHFQEHEISILLVQIDGGDSNALSLKSIFGNFALFGGSDEQQQNRQQEYDGKKSNKSVVVSSWTASVAELKEYVTAICDYKQSAQVTRMFCAKRSDDGASDVRKAKDRSLEWQEVHVKTNKRLHNTIVSRSVQENLFDDVQSFMRSEAWYNEKGIPYTRGYLLHGPPGTGKTSVIKAIAAEYNLSVFIIDLEIVKTNEQFSSLMKQINYLCEQKPYVLALEDIDRSSLFDRYRGERISMACFLNEIDGLVESHGRLLFLTANDVDIVRGVNQQALTRPGRIDKQIEIGFCDFDQVQRMLIHIYGLEHAFLQNLKECDMRKDRKYSPADLISLLRANIDKPPHVAVRHLFNTEKIKDMPNCPVEVEQSLSLPTAGSGPKNFSNAKTRQISVQIDRQRARMTMLKVQYDRAKKEYGRKDDQKYWERLKKRAETTETNLAKKRAYIKRLDGKLKAEIKKEKEKQKAAQRAAKLCDQKERQKQLPEPKKKARGKKRSPSPALRRACVGAHQRKRAKKKLSINDLQCQQNSNSKQHAYNLRRSARVPIHHNSNLPQ